MPAGTQTCSWSVADCLTDHFVSHLFSSSPDQTGITSVMLFLATVHNCFQWTRKLLLLQQQLFI